MSVKEGESANVEDFGILGVAPIDIDDTAYFSVQNILNGVIMFVVAIPIILMGSYVVNDCPMIAQSRVLQPITLPLNTNTFLGVEDAFCRIGLFHPIAFVNLVFFMNINVIFWLIATVQDNSWLIGV